MKQEKLAGLALIALSVGAGCSEGPSGPASASDSIGSLEMSVGVSGIQFDAVFVTFSSESLTPAVIRQHSVALDSADSTVSLVEHGLPVGDYSVELRVVPLDDSETKFDESTVDCAGAVHGVAVRSQEVTVVSDLILTCGESGGGLHTGGSIRVDARVELGQAPQSCEALIERVSVSPDSAQVGGGVSLSAVLPEGVSSHWTAASGMISDSDARVAQYRCPSSAGKYDVTLTARQGTDCTERYTVSIDCVGIQSATCGNGTVEDGESCDDGNTVTEGCEYGLATCEVCSADCSLAAATGAFCGDLFINGPEACDGSASCSSDCTGTEPAGRVCEACVSGPSQDAAYVEFNAGCNNDPLCVAVKQCLINDASLPGARSCFSGIPAECYCGIGSDLTACEMDPSFEASGPCASVIVAGAGADATRLDVLPRLSDSRFATGQAYLIVDEATRVCAGACGFAP